MKDPMVFRFSEPNAANASAIELEPAIENLSRASSVPDSVILGLTTSRTGQLPATWILPKTNSVPVHVILVSISSIAGRPNLNEKKKGRG